MLKIVHFGNPVILTIFRKCQKVFDYFLDLASTFFPFMSFDYSSRYRYKIQMYQWYNKTVIYQLLSGWAKSSKMTLSFKFTYVVCNDAKLQNKLYWTTGIQTYLRSVHPRWLSSSWHTLSLEHWPGRNTPLLLTRSTWWSLLSKISKLLSHCVSKMSHVKERGLTKVTFLSNLFFIFHLFLEGKIQFQYKFIPLWVRGRPLSNNRRHEVCHVTKVRMRVKLVLIKK